MGSIFPAGLGWTYCVNLLNGLLEKQKKLGS